MGQPCCHLLFIQKGGSRIGPIPHCSLGWVRLWDRWGLLHSTEAPPRVVKTAGGGTRCVPARSRRRTDPGLICAGSFRPPPRPAPPPKRPTPGPWGVGAAALLPSGAESAVPQLGGGSDHPLAGTLPAILPDPSPRGSPNQTAFTPQWEGPPKSWGPREREGSSE